MPYKLTTFKLDDGVGLIRLNGPNDGNALIPEMALLNPILSARQALDWGLVDQVVADDQILISAFEGLSGDLILRG